MGEDPVKTKKRARSKIDTLPPELRKRLEVKLIAGDFTSYVALSKWLADQGYEISYKIISRYGRGIEGRMEAVKLATQQAKAIVDAGLDGKGAMNDALTLLVQEKLFNVLVRLSSINTRKLGIGGLARIIATLGRASIDQKKFEQDMRARVAIKVRTADEEIAQVAKQGGIPMEVSQKIRNALLGIGV